MTKEVWVGNHRINFAKWAISRESYTKNLKSGQYLRRAENPIEMCRPSKKLFLDVFILF